MAYKKLILEEVKKHPNIDIIKLTELCAKKIMKCESGSVKIEEIDKFKKLKNAIGHEIGTLRDIGYVGVGTNWNLYLHGSLLEVKNTITAVLTRDEEPKSEEKLLYNVSRCFLKEVFDEEIYSDALKQLFNDKTLIRNSKNEICLKHERDKWL